MKDKKIQEILKQDKALPERPAHEWTNIQREIEREQSSFSFNLFFIPASATIIFLLAWFIGNSNINKDKLHTEALLAQDLSEISNYLNETEEFYSWID